jgi:hypothetical protein
MIVNKSIEALLRKAELTPIFSADVDIGNFAELGINRVTVYRVLEEAAQ